MDIFVVLLLWFALENFVSSLTVKSFHANNMLVCQYEYDCLPVPLCA